MKRGSTPVHIFRTNVDLTGARVYVTYSQNGRAVVEKTGEDVAVMQDMVIVRLSQKDTLSFRASCHTVQMQIRYVFSDGTADASDIMEAEVGEVLKDGEIAYV